VLDSGSNEVRWLPNPSPEPLGKTAKQSIGWEYGPLHLAVSVATAAVGAEPHRVTKSQHFRVGMVGFLKAIEWLDVGRWWSLRLKRGK